MSEIQIRVKPEQLGQLRAQIPQFEAEIEARIVTRLQAQGRALIAAMLGRWQTGSLAASLQVEVMGEGIKMFLGSGLAYTDYVMFGAEPHTITPKGAKALHWNRFGIDFFFKRVQHPGQRARSDIFDALSELAMRITREEVLAVLSAVAIAGAG